MGYEIDFLPVGNGEKSGDAIALRYGTDGNYKVMVTDGGTRDSGDMLVEHINKYYNTNIIDFMVCTHPDADHSSGLRTVIEQIQVNELWMHRPWNYSKDILDFVDDGRVTHNGLSEKIKNSLNAAYELAELALKKTIPIYEPFQGSEIGVFRVLSPTQDFYKNLLIEQYGDNKIDEQSRSLFASIMDSVKNAGEKWGFETLQENGITSPLNETSTVLYANIDNRGILLTGDVGIRGLEHAMNYADSISLNIKDNLRFIQIPHHGSRRNVSPSILDRLIGEKLPTGVQRDASLFACVSASGKSTTHPRKSVTNAFIRRGASVTSNLKGTIRHSHNMPNREGWITAETIPFYEGINAVDDAIVVVQKEVA